MTRYYFHVHDRLGLLEDKEGSELSGVDDVEPLALEYAREMITDSANQYGTLGLNRAFEVKNRDGITVHRLQFREAVEVEIEPKSR